MSKRKGDGEKQHSPEIWMKAWENRGLVFSTAQRYFPHIRDHDEFLIDGLKGLCLAIERHDPAKGKLSSIAQPHIRSLIARGMAEQRSLIHVPANVRERADYPGISMIRESETWRWDNQTSGDEAEPDAAAIKAGEIVEEALSALPSQQAETVRRYFGIGPGRYEQDLSEISEDLGVAKATALSHLRRGMDRMKTLVKQRPHAG